LDAAITSYPTEGRNASPGWRILAKLRALRDSSLDLESFALCVAITLRENSSTGRTTAAIATLAQDAKISRATAWRRRAYLRRLGIIRCRRRRNRTSELWVDLAVLRNYQRETLSGRDAQTIRLIDTDVSRGDPNSLQDNSHINSQKKATPGAASPAPGKVRSDSRLYKDALDYAWQQFTKKLGQPPTWDEKDFKQLSRLLKRHPQITLEEFRRR